MKTIMSLMVILICLPMMANGAITSQTFTMNVGQVIPDATEPVSPGPPLYSTISEPLGYNIVDVEIYFNITTPSEGSSDLIIKLTSPTGTELRILFIGEGGEPGTSPAGWYPTDFTPKDDLAQWIGEQSAGDWVLKCQDYSYDKEATLNEWRLKITYDDALAEGDDTWSGVKTLYR